MYIDIALVVSVLSLLCDLLSVDCLLRSLLLVSYFQSVAPFLLSSHRFTCVSESHIILFSYVHSHLSLLYTCLGDLIYSFNFFLFSYFSLSLCRICFFAPCFFTSYFCVIFIFFFITLVLGILI